MTKNIYIFFQDGESGMIKHKKFNKCLEALKEQIVVRDCDSQKLHQRWKFETYPSANVPAGAPRTWF